MGIVWHAISFFLKKLEQSEKEAVKVRYISADQLFTQELLPLWNITAFCMCVGSNADSFFFLLLKQHMPYFRKRMVWEILHRKLL